MTWPPASSGRAAGFRPRILVAFSDDFIDLRPVRPATERAAGVGYHELVRRCVLDPAHMTDTAFLRSDELRQYRVDVETDSTVQETVDRDLAGLREVIGAVGELFAGVQAGVPGDVAKEVALAVARRARMGGAVEDALDQFQPTSPEDDMKRMTEQVMGMVQEPYRRELMGIRKSRFLIKTRLNLLPHSRSLD